MAREQCDWSPVADVLVVHNIAQEFYLKVISNISLRAGSESMLHVEKQKQEKELMGIVMAMHQRMLRKSGSGILLRTHSP